MSSLNRQRGPQTHGAESGAWAGNLAQPCTREIEAQVVKDLIPTQVVGAQSALPSPEAPLLSLLQSFFGILKHILGQCSLLSLLRSEKNGNKPFLEKGWRPHFWGQEAQVLVLTM